MGASSKVSTDDALQLQGARSRERITVPLSPDGSATVGSGDGCSLCIAGTGVEPEHARFGPTSEGFAVEPCAGAPVRVNGSPIDGPTPLRSGDWLALGGEVFRVAAAPASTPPAAEGGSAARSGALTIGRLPESDIVIDSPAVSRVHARLEWSDGSWQLEDLGSTNGTFVEGRRVEGQVMLAPGALVQFASFPYRFDGARLREAGDAGGIRVEVRDLTKTVPDQAGGSPKRLLDGICFTVEPGTFVGVFGTSGSGKSTLIDALCGRRPATKGTVLYSGTDLYANFDAFRSTIGYVPQQDIVHRGIRVSRTLTYTARLRLPEDTSDKEVEANVQRVLERVGLLEMQDLVVDTPAPLSGGQLKRVSLAVELASNPQILFLDEVTSGLDAGTDKRMMRLFAELAKDGRTIFCVTHTLENIDACDLVVLLHAGRLVYFGPPGAAVEHFGVARLSDVYELLEGEPAEPWVERYRASRLHDEWIEGRMKREREPEAERTASAERTGATRQAWRQTRILTRRHVELLLADRRNLAILLVQAPIVAAVVGLVFDVAGTAAERAAAERQISFLLVVSAIWFGCLDSAREVVKELPIYLRERAVNLGLSSYIASKLGPLAVICALQAALLLGTVKLLLPYSSAWAGGFAVLFATALAGAGMGLAVSALVDSNDKAIAAVPILLIPQVVLANAIVPLGGASEWVARLTMISWWGFDAIQSTLSEATRAAVGIDGAPILQVQGGLAGDLGALAGLFALFVVAAALGLRLKDRRS